MSAKNNEPASIAELLRGKKVPILVLDQRWHKLFPGGVKPAHIAAIEENLNALLKEQGKLVNEIKDLKKAKKKLMDAIVSGMSSSGNDKKKDKQQKLLLETKERIEAQSDRLMELPYEIKKTNEDLLINGVAYCYEELKIRAQSLEDLKGEIDSRREELKEKVAYRVELEESVDAIYSLMHALLGREVMNLFDKK